MHIPLDKNNVEVRLIHDKDKALAMVSFQVMIEGVGVATSMQTLIIRKYSFKMGVRMS